MSRGVAALLLRDLRTQAAKLDAVRERILLIEDPERRNALLARHDSIAAKLQSEIRKAERRLARIVAPRESFKLVRLDREIAAVRLSLAGTRRCSLPRRRPPARRVRTSRTSRGSPVPLPGDDDEHHHHVGLARLGGRRGVDRSRA
jgi:hypothetical protein